jgi:hypothetical protein
LWAVEIKKLHKLHLTGNSERAEPLAVTLCGKVYDPADRIRAWKGKETTAASHQFCKGCLKAAGVPVPARPVDRTKTLADILKAIDSLRFSSADKRATAEAAIKLINNTPQP